LTLEVLTFGCRLNAAESAAIAGMAAHLADTLVVNTCAVTAEAEREARSAIRRAHRDRPERAIIVTGCASQLAPAAWAALPGVARVVDNCAKTDPASWGNKAGAAPARTRATIPVQNGCDHSCTFCIIPAGRGAARSLPAEQVITAVRAAAQAGAAEVVLTGVDLTAWGADLPDRPRLGSLVLRILDAVPALPRLRLSSLDPAELDADLFTALRADPRLMPHLHLSVQAGDDLVLARMKRRHRRADILRAAERARAARADVALGADLIAGFPTETEAMAERSVLLVGQAGLTWLHVFPFSPRPGTPAARMPQVAGAIVRQRAARLREAGEAAAGRFLHARLGMEEHVVTERGGGGRTAHYAPVRGLPHPAGVLARIVPTRIEHGALIA
jgi:threonylcarbamoyladenosine tRNA methylthiotransferase MtaB